MVVSDVSSKRGDIVLCMTLPKWWISVSGQICTMFVGRVSESLIFLTKLNSLEVVYFTNYLLISFYTSNGRMFNMIHNINSLAIFCQNYFNLHRG